MKRATLTNLLTLHVQRLDEIMSNETTIIHDDDDTCDNETIERVERALKNALIGTNETRNEHAKLLLHACDSFATLYDMFCAHDEYNDDDFYERVIACYALLRH